MSNKTRIVSGLLTTSQAADYLGYSKHTLKIARHSGQLAGVTGPIFKRFGRQIRYGRTDLDCWVSQFKNYSSSSQYR